ncbi:MAG: helix-turn-helix transcriptional regulator [Desulfamplus sp.]|nr:helix-turn-helix transcriptional regulator [Desulfamplus sp.]
MSNFSEHETSFMNATIYHTYKYWNGSKSLFADKIGVSPSYVSQIISRKKCPITATQEKIAKNLGYKNLSDFINFGEKLTPTDLASVIPAMQMDGVKKDTNKAPTLNIEDHANICNIQDEATKRHQIVIEGFEDREWAIAVNEILVQIEKRNPGQKVIIKEILSGVLRALPDEESKKGQLNGTLDVK